MDEAIIKTVIVKPLYFINFSSEKVFWRKVLKIYATSIDYDSHAESSVLFFKQVQNKMHWAAHKHTAAEVIYERADAEKENMGLTSWEHDEIRRSDVEVAKNYLTEQELDALNKIVTAYLDIAEVHALNKEPMPLFVSSAVTPAVQFTDIFVGIVRHRQKAGNLPALNL